MKLTTFLPIETCQARLATTADPERYALTFSGYKGSKPILVRSKGTKFRLQKRRYYHNSYAPFFYGQFIPTGSGTIIEGSFKMHPAAKIAMFVWCAILASIILIAALAPLGGQARPGGTVQVSSFMLLLGLGMVMFGRWLGRGEVRALSEFLHETLEAHEAT